jgi:hypothetical protein
MQQQKKTFCSYFTYVAAFVDYIFMYVFHQKHYKVQKMVDCPGSTSLPSFTFTGDPKIFKDQNMLWTG